MTKKRTKLEIIRDILQVIKSKNKVRPTHILYKSNLSHNMMEEYLAELKAKDFIIESKETKTRTFEITEKGRTYLEKFKEIMAFTDSFGLSEANN